MDIFLVRPYSSWKRAHNKRHKGLLRAYSPKGESIDQYTDEHVLFATDELNGRPRRKLGYRNFLKRFWIPFSQPDGCGILTHRRSLRLRLYPRVRKVLHGTVQLVLAICSFKS